MTNTELEQRLASDFHCLNRLQKVLLREQEMLASQKLDALPGLLVEKSRLLDEMEANHPGQSTPSKEWQYIQSRLTVRDSAINTKISPLLELFSHIERLNQVNSRIAARMQQAFGNLLHVLRGNHQAPALYSASGQTVRKHPGGNTLAQG